MKKFKLIQSYPGCSVKLGTEVFKNGNHYQSNFATQHCVDHFHQPLHIVENQPKFWQEIVEEDYKILKLVTSYDDFLDLHDNGMYAYKGASNYRGVGSLILKKALEDPFYKIYSVERLSDGEIFTVGDEVGIINPKGWDRNPTHKIDSFFLNDDKTLGLVCKTNVAVVGNPCQEEYRSGTFTINDITKRIPLFTTEDGVDIFEGDKFWYVNNIKTNGYCLNESNPNKPSDYKKVPDIKDFSTKEKAKEYILMNKPCLSLNDLFSVVKQDRDGDNGFSTSRLGSMFRNLAKTKI